MNARMFPWSPVLAGFGAGVTGFAAAALATGGIHLGSAGSCRLADHQSATTAALAAQAHTMATPCPCCCEGHRTVTVAEDDGAGPQLAAIETPPPAMAWAGCEDGAWPGDAANITPTSAEAVALNDAEMDLARPVEPLVAIIEPTAAHVGDSGDGAANLNPGLVRPPADKGWSGLANPSVAPNGIAAALAGGAAGSFGGGGSSRSPRALALIESAATTTDFGLVPSRLATLPWAELTQGATPTTWLAATSVGLVDAAPTDTLAQLAAGMAAAEQIADGAALALAATPAATFAALPAAGSTGSTANPVVTVAVPEPSSFLLASIGMGLAGLAYRRRGTRPV